MINSWNEKEKKRRIEQIPIAYESRDELSRLIGFLRSKGYTGYARGSGPRAVYLDLMKKTYHRPSVMVMACWCSGRNRYPLTVDQFMENFVRIVIDDDTDFYNELLRKRYEERHSSQ